MTKNLLSENGTKVHAPNGTGVRIACVENQEERPTSGVFMSDEWVYAKGRDSRSSRLVPAGGSPTRRSVVLVYTHGVQDGQGNWVAERTRENLTEYPLYRYGDRLGASGDEVVAAAVAALRDHNVVQGYSHQEWAVDGRYLGYFQGGEVDEWSEEDAGYLVGLSEEESRRVHASLVFTCFVCGRGDVVLDRESFLRPHCPTPEPLERFGEHGKHPLCEGSGTPPVV